MGYDTYHGYVDRVENGWVLGWAWQATRPNDPVQLICTWTARWKHQHWRNSIVPILSASAKRMGLPASDAPDTAFVKVSSPMEFAANWIALEDAKEGSGELEYYIGSHRLDDYLFQGKFKAMPFKSNEQEPFLASLHEKSKAKGLRRERFSQKREMFSYGMPISFMVDVMKSLKE
jgi:hypothetical protein